MSRENLEAVRRIFGRWGQGDFQEGVELYDPHIVLVLRAQFPDAGRYCGVEEVASYTRDLLLHWEHLVMEGEEFLEAGDSVVVGLHQQGTGVGSGAPTGLRYFMVWTFRGDSVIRIESIMERAEALEAVGLSA
jgi:ketosteroid isomerase-like protein